MEGLGSGPSYPIPKVFSHFLWRLRMLLRQVLNSKALARERGGLWITSEGSCSLITCDRGKCSYIRVVGHILYLHVCGTY